MLRAVVLGLAGLLLTGLALIAYVGLSPQGAGQGPAATATTAILVAAHPVRAGSLLQPGDIAARDVAAADLAPGAIADSAAARSALVGAMLRRMLDERDAIAGEDVLRPGDRGFLAAVLAPGTRAVSVAVDAVSGEAGLIWPGDRIDLLLTQELEHEDRAAGHRISGETVLSDVRVIAVDQQLIQGGQQAGLLEGRGPASRTITLEVTPHDAARIAVATRLGKLQVVLRSAETAVAQAQGAPALGGGNERATVWGSDVSRALGAGPQGHEAEVRLFQGTHDMQSYKF